MREESKDPIFVDSVIDEFCQNPLKQGLSGKLTKRSLEVIKRSANEISNELSLGKDIKILVSPLDETPKLYDESEVNYVCTFVSFGGKWSVVIRNGLIERLASTGLASTGESPLQGAKDLEGFDLLQAIVSRILNMQRFQTHRVVVESITRVSGCIVTENLKKMFLQFRVLLENKEGEESIDVYVDGLGASRLMMYSKFGLSTKALELLSAMRLSFDVLLPVNFSYTDVEKLRPGSKFAFDELFTDDVIHMRTRGVDTMLRLFSDGCFPEEEVLSYSNDSACEARKANWQVDRSTIALR